MKLQLWQLRQRQSLPLEAKIKMSQARIREWYEHWSGQVYVAFSGGKDSTVLLHLVRQMYPDVPAVFVATGTQYPEVRRFVKTIENVDWIRPEKSFKQVIEEYGYPVVSKKVARFIRDVRNPTERNEATRHLRLTGYTQDGRYMKGMKIPDRWMFLVNAPFKISEQCCDVMKKRPFLKHVKQTGRQAIVGTMAEDSQQKREAISASWLYEF